MAHVDRHRAHLGDALWEKRQRERVQGKFMEILRDCLFQEAVETMRNDGQWQPLLDDLAERRIDPYSAMEKVAGQVTPASVRPCSWERDSSFTEMGSSGRRTPRTGPLNRG